MGIYLNCVPLHGYCIPLCLNLKFRKLYRLAARDTPTSKKLLKLQLGPISISDIEMVKRRVPLLDSQPFLRVRDLKFSLGKSGRFRTSGGTFWSRSTGGRFDPFRIRV